MSIEEYLHTSGKYKQLSETLRQQLQASGWADDVYAMAVRELSVASDTSLDGETLKKVQKLAVDQIPPEVLTGISKQIREMVDDVVEKA